MAHVARALGVELAPQGLCDLAKSLGAPVSLAAIGMRREDLDKAAEMAVRSPYWNPREVTVEGVRGVLEDAFEGKRPE